MWVGEPVKIEGKKKYYSKVLVDNQEVCVGKREVHMLVSLSIRLFLVMQCLFILMNQTSRCT